MAIVVEETVLGSVDGGSSLSLTSWTPGANELVLVAVAVRDESVSVSVAGNGLTFVEVADVDNVQGQCGISLFRAMGASPSTGQITVTLGASTVCQAVACRFSGVDSGGTNGSSAVEASATDAGPDPDNDDMLISVTTVTDGAWAVAFGTHRLQTFTVPGGETGISINNSAGSGGEVTSCSAWYEEVASAGATTVGAAADLGGDSDWAVIGVSVKPADGGGGDPGGGGGDALLQVALDDSALYDVGLGDAGAYDVVLQDAGGYEVVIGDAGRFDVGLQDAARYDVALSDTKVTAS